MGNLMNGIPYIELQERIAKIARIDSQNDRPKIRGIIQNVYLMEIPRKYDWNFLYATTSLYVAAAYDEGAASITTGGNLLTFTTSATISADMTGRKIKIEANDYTYDFTYTGVTSGTISPNFYGTTNADSNTYKIFVGEVTLPLDFDRFPKNGGLVYYTGGRKKQIPEEPVQEYFENYNPSPSQPTKCRLTGTDTMGRQKVELRPPIELETYLGCEYFKQLAPLSMTSNGLIDVITSGTVTVTGIDSRFTDAKAGDYFRVDAMGVAENSQWYRIASVTHNSALTLSTAFATTSISSANYCISSMPDLPPKMQDAIMWGALRTLSGDQGDPMFQFYNAQLAEVLSDGKRLFMTRIPAQQIHSVAEEFHYRR